VKDVPTAGWSGTSRVALRVLSGPIVPSRICLPADVDDACAEFDRSQRCV
jgi:hypothetical protein